MYVKKKKRFSRTFRNLGFCTDSIEHYYVFLKKGQERIQIIILQFRKMFYKKKAKILHSCTMFAHLGAAKLPPIAFSYRELKFLGKTTAHCGLMRCA